MPVTENGEASRGNAVIVFGKQRPSAKRSRAGRFFAPVRNVIGSAVESATTNPRAILRMVSGYC